MNIYLSLSINDAIKLNNLLIAAISLMIIMLVNMVKEYKHNMKISHIIESIETHDYVPIYLFRAFIFHIIIIEI